ncbi:MAG: DUF4296 domain-containing protein [Ferruginibacter sp.]
MRILFAVTIIILFFSCSRKKKLPEGILEPQKMQNVFWDYIRADVYTKDIMKKDSTINDTTENIKLQNKIFSFYKIDRTDFYKSYDYYEAHPDLMNVLMDTILAKQNRIKLNSQLKANKNRVMPDDRNKILPVARDRKTPGLGEGSRTMPGGRKKILPDSSKKNNPVQKVIKVD